MTTRGRYGLAATVLLVTLLAALPALASEPGLTGSVTAENIPGSGFYSEEEHRWTPPQVSVKSGGVVTISNPTKIRHGVHWINPPSEPACDSGVPVGETETVSSARTEWSGTCMFSKAGSYTYYCTVHGAKMAGTITVSGTPTATTEAAAEVIQDGATLKGAIRPEGNATQYRFEYGSTSVSEHTTGTFSLGATDFASHTVSVHVPGLASGVKYEFQLVAIYGEAKPPLPGGKLTFTTPVPSAPTVTTGQAGGLTEAEATLNGAVDPNDGEATEYFFEYGTSAGYGQTTVVTALPTDTVNHQVSVPLSGLAPGTEYHFRLVAKNEIGPGEGADQTFKTTSPSASPSESQPPATTASTAPPPPPQAKTSLVEPPPLGPPIVGSPSLALTQHGTSVHGSLQVSPSGVGGTLEVDLLAKSASLAKARHSGSVRVGRLSRTPLSAGKLSFSVALNAAAKRALKRNHRLSITVKITLTPAKGSSVIVTHRVTLRA
jgi:plastocyanin